MSDAEDHTAEMKAKLDELQEEIDEATADAEKVLPKKPEETFVQPGTVGTDQVDNTIAPPG